MNSLKAAKLGRRSHKMRELISEASKTVEDSQTAQALHGLLSLKSPEATPLNNTNSNLLGRNKSLLIQNKSPTKSQTKVVKKDQSLASNFKNIKPKNDLAVKILTNPYQLLTTTSLSMLTYSLPSTSVISANNPFVNVVKPIKLVKNNIKDKVVTVKLGKSVPLTSIKPSIQESIKEDNELFQHIQKAFSELIRNIRNIESYSVRTYHFSSNIYIIYE